MNSVLVMELQKPFSVAKFFTARVWGYRNLQFKELSPKLLLELVERCRGAPLKAGRGGGNIVRVIKF